jgi:hypothetical protein
VFAMLSGIDRVSFSARQTPPKPGVPASAADADALVLINGTFDAQMLKLMFGGGGGAMQIKQIDPRTMLIGTEPSFTQALTRLSGPANAASSVELESSDLFMEGDLTRLAQQQAQPTPAALQNVRRFAMGMNAGENVEFSLVLTAADPSDVEFLMKTFHDLMAQAGQTPENAAMIAKAFDLRQDGAKLRIHFVPTPEMIKTAQQAAASGDTSNAFAGFQPLLGMLGMPGAAPAPPVKSSIAPPSNGGKIMIYGLDGGPKEITPAK